MKIMNVLVPVFCLAVIVLGFVSFAPELAYVFRAEGFGGDRALLVGGTIVGGGVFGYGVRKYIQTQDMKGVAVYLFVGLAIFLGVWFGIPAQLRVDASQMQSVYDAIHGK